MAAAVKELQPLGRAISTRTLAAAQRCGGLKTVKVGARTMVPRREIARLRNEYEAFLRKAEESDDLRFAKFFDLLSEAELAAPEKALGKWLKHWRWAGVVVAPERAASSSRKERRH